MMNDVFHITLQREHIKKFDNVLRRLNTSKVELEDRNQIEVIDYQ